MGVTFQLGKVSHIASQIGWSMQPPHIGNNQCSSFRNVINFQNSSNKCDTCPHFWNYLFIKQFGKKILLEFLKIFIIIMSIIICTLLIVQHYVNYINFVIMKYKMFGLSTFKHNKVWNMICCVLHLYPLSFHNFLNEMYNFMLWIKTSLFIHFGF
jgi:hypothetical protein